MQHTECTEVCESLSESNDGNLREKHIESVSGHAAGELMESVSKDANLSEKTCDEMENTSTHNAAHLAEMEMNTGGGDLGLHYSDLYSHEPVPSAEMQMDSGSGHVRLHHSNLYSHKAVPSMELQIDSGRRNVALHHSDLYSHEALPSVELQMDSGSGQVVLQYSDLYSQKNCFPRGNANGQWQWAYLLYRRRGFIYCSRGGI